ncbi:MBL fold metallo-hydrolase [Halorhodospira halochloris]|uniref:MBL fold metallo-hydrolase n=1 Tax=Halorhodospira halochloris TaxID=1052 RepID=UPI001EE82E9E|nr:MBL fold metallo-hydrolase [Halorhodospira halochloris]MCG5549499.1 MBL fold metallo-hydrolase [Halorhodospira halochloris]
MGRGTLEITERFKNMVRKNPPIKSFARLLIVITLISTPALKCNADDFDLVYSGYGAQETVSGSLHSLNYKGNYYLIDVGSFMADEGENYPWPDALNPEDIQAVFITHAHADHLGRLPLLLHKGYSGPIYMTEVTYDIAMVTLPENVTRTDLGQERFYYSRHNKGDKRIPVYKDGYDFGRYTVDRDNRIYFEASRPELDEMGFYFPRSQREKLQEELKDRIESQVRIVQPGETIEVADAKVQSIHTSHMPGSVMFKFSVAGKDLLFSGDVGGDRSPFLASNPRLDGSVDYLWLEGTYDDVRDIDAQQQRRDFRSHLGELVESGYRIVIPAFVVDRTQQVLYEISQGIDEGLIPDHTPVKVYSSTANEITNLYRGYTEDPRIRDRYFSEKMRPGIFSMPGYEEPDVNWDSSNPLDLSHGSIGIMSSGMVEHAYSLRALKDYGNDPSTVFYIVGYQAPGTPGNALEEGRDLIRLTDGFYEVNAESYSTDAFSGHADPGQMLDIYGQMDIGQLFLVHLDKRNVEPLTRFYQNTLDVPTKAPEREERITLD